MNLKEWNEILEMADRTKGRIINILGINGTADFYVYRMFDERKGVTFILKDKIGEVFKTYYSGVIENKEDFKKSLEKLEYNILQECK